MEFRTYASRATAKKALKRFQLDDMLVRFDILPPDYLTKKRIKPVILCDAQVEKRRVEEHGFAAEIKETEFREGATVSLHPSVTAGNHHDLARIKQRVDGLAEGAVVLDRELAGTKWWNIDSLVLA